MDRTLEMSVFVAVVEADSFIGAAQALDMSRTAVSRHIDLLERRLDVRLLQRTTRRLSLTDEGRVFYRRAKEILSALDEAETEVTSRHKDVSGLIRINVPLSFGISDLAPLWGKFLAAHPGIELDITLNDRVVDLLEEGYDLAVRIGTLSNSSLISRKLASTHILACATPTYLARHGIPRHPADLQQHRVIAYSNWSGRNEWSFNGPEGLVSVRTQARVNSNNGDTCRAIALEHGGILLQPGFLIDKDLRDGTLVELMPEYRCTALGVYAVYPSRKHLSVKVRYLIDFLAAAFADVAWAANERPMQAVNCTEPHGGT